MKIVLNENISEPLTVTIGSFDGIHCGHRQLIKRVISDAKKNNSKSALITFSPHPRVVIDPTYQIDLLNTDEEKKEILDHIGLDYLIIIEFSKILMNIKPEIFIQKLISKFDIKEFVMGYNHSFGKNRQGNNETICKILLPHKIKYSIIEEVKAELHKVSSTIIREYLQNNEFLKASKILGYFYFIKGKTIHGHKVGTKLGYPTINIQPPTKHKLTPSDGVYITSAIINKARYYGATSIGNRPTFDGRERVIETFLFDFDQKVYGEEIKIFFLEKIRDGIKFDKIGDLQTKITEDVSYAKKYLTEHTFENSYFI